MFKHVCMSWPSGQMVKVVHCSLILSHLEGSSVGLHGFAVLLGLGAVLEDLN